MKWKILKQIFEAAQVLTGDKPEHKIISGQVWTKNSYILTTKSARTIFIRTIKIGVAYNLDYFTGMDEWKRNGKGSDSLGHKLLKIK